MRMRRALLGLALVASWGAPAPAKDAEPVAVAFVAPDSGPSAETAGEVRLGIEAALASRTVADVPMALRPSPLPADRKALDALFARLKKEAPPAVLAWVPDGRTPDVERAAAKSGVPLIVLSPEATAPSLDPDHAVFWAGGMSPADEALQAMDFVLLPIGAKRPAVLHDGSRRGADAASRCAALHHVSLDPLPPAVLPETFDAAQAAALVAGDAPGRGCDAIVYFGGPVGAERLLRATAEVKVPVLLGQGLASFAVPTFALGQAKDAWALEVAWLPDHDAVARDDQQILEDAAKGSGRPLVAATIRGYRAGRFVMDAVRKGGVEPKRFLPALRALAWERARDRPVFDPWCHAALGRFTPWRSAPERKEPACRRVRPTLMPMAGIPQIGTFVPSRFRWEEGTTYVHCSFGKDAQRTIEEDLKALGLHTGGYEGSLETWILDDLMGRFLSRMNRLFRRNPDGTSIPGLSWNISFVTEPPPKGVKAQKLYIIIAGDDPAAGGRASGNLALVFSTFLQRTMYAERALAPPVSASDRPYLAGAYKWGTSLEENLRCDTVRALLDGYSQAMALTGAHEVGHILGCGHDTVTPRSIMNVVDAVGLDFEWAEWIPEHVKFIDQRLGRAGDRD